MQYRADAPAICIVLTMFVMAQKVPDSPIALDLRRAEELALEQNVSLRVSKNQSLMAQSAKDEAFSRFLPELSAEASYGYLSPRPGVKKEIIPGVNLNLTQPSDNYSYGLRLRQILYSGGRISTAFEIAKLGEKASQWLLKDSGRNAIFQARNLYFRALLMNELQTLASENAKRANDRWKEAQSQYRAGTISKVELLKSEAEQSGAELAATRAKDDFEASLNELKLSLGMDHGASVRLVGRLQVQRFPEVDIASLRAATPSYANAEAASLQAKQARMGVDMAEAEYWPVLSAGLSYDYKNPYLGQDKFGSGYGVFFQATMPLFDGGKRSSEVEQARLRAENAEMIAKDIYEQLENQRALLEDRIDSLSRSLLVREKSIRTARAARDAMAVAARNGAATTSDLAESELTLFQMNVEQSNAIAQLLIALSGWERLTGQSSKTLTQWKEGALQ
ncbi:MAG: TolC family protein [Leptospiraceae bacterium]|nr:TolC family protein [Leptospiraceae bacterium]